MEKTVLILSGPTHEYLDPVRFIGNASSGLMGKALAEEAMARGYFVRFITGPIADSNLPDLGANGEIHRITSADDMLNLAANFFHSSDVAIFAAAVADYAPIEKSTKKRPKSENDLILHLRSTPDIAKTLCETKRINQISIGFALQTNDGEVLARKKLERKSLDGIILNTPTTLGAINGEFSFLDARSNTFDEWGCIDKKECAHRIFQQVENLIREK